MPTHTHLSSTDYGGIGIYDKALGGVAMIGMMYHGTKGASLYEANGANPFSKYNLDILRESLSVVKQGGYYCNRFRLAYMVVDKIREAIGDDFVLELRISATLGVPNHILLRKCFIL